MSKNIMITGMRSGKNKLNNEVIAKVTELKLKMPIGNARVMASNMVLYYKDQMNDERVIFWNLVKEML